MRKISFVAIVVNGIESKQITHRSLSWAGKFALFELTIRGVPSLSKPGTPFSLRKNPLLVLIPFFGEIEKICRRAKLASTISNMMDAEAQMIETVRFLEDGFPTRRRILSVTITISIFSPDSLADSVQKFFDQDLRLTYRP